MDKESMGSAEEKVRMGFRDIEKTECLQQSQYQVFRCTAKEYNQCEENEASTL